MKTAPEPSPGEVRKEYLDGDEPFRDVVNPVSLDTPIETDPANFAAFEMEGYGGSGTGLAAERHGGQREMEMHMDIKIPITSRIIQAAERGTFKGGPLALAIFLKVPRVQEVFVSSETIEVIRDEGQADTYTNSDEVEGWLDYFHYGARVPAGILSLGMRKSRGDVFKKWAFFDEYDRESVIVVDESGPRLID